MAISLNEVCKKSFTNSSSFSDLTPDVDNHKLDHKLAAVLASQPASSLQYGAWKLDCQTDVSLAKGMINDEAVSVHLKEGGLVPWEGWWPMEPTTTKAVIAGSCLWDGRWQCSFRGSSTKWRLALTSDREQAFKRMDEGKVLKKLFIPSCLGRYHLDLVRWQSEQLKRLRPEKVIYHIPAGEYHLYISELEMHLKMKLPDLHHQLETFVAALRNMVEAELGPYTRELQFFSPENVEDAAESYLDPYLRARDLGEYGEVAALEDLAELRLAHTAAQRQNQSPIPVFYCVLGIPDPYHKKNLVDGEFLEVSVPSAACPVA